jgi:hypothetical protein
MDHVEDLGVVGGRISLKCMLKIGCEGQGAIGGLLLTRC